MGIPSYRPDNSLALQLPENVEFSSDFSQFLIQLTDLYSKIAQVSNSKEDGRYDLIELVNGQEFFSDNPQVKNQIYRKVVATGALKNAAATTQAHGLNGGAAVPATWLFTRIDGFARAAATPEWISLSNGGIRDCAIQVLDTDIVITPTVDLSAFTESWVVLEYYK